MTHMKPTPEQAKYLASIGVAITYDDSEEGRRAGSLPPGTKADKDRTYRWHWWWVALVLIAMVIVGVVLGARAEELPAEGVPLCSDERAFLSDTLTDRLIDCRRSIISVWDEDKMMELEEPESAIRHLHGDVEALPSEHVRGKSAVEDDRDVGLDGPDETASERSGELEAHLEAEPQKLWSTSPAEDKAPRWAMVMVGVLAALACGAYLMHEIATERRLRRVERRIAADQLQAAGADEGVPAIPLTPGEGKAGGNGQVRELEFPIAADTKGAQPSEVVHSPVREFKAFLAEGADVDEEFCCRPWSVGMATITGNVRSVNEDYGVCFEIRGRSAMIVADGCGGMPLGQRAAYLATVSAAVTVVCGFGKPSYGREPSVQDIALDAILNASNRLRAEGDTLGIADLRGGLRTTLIVVVAYGDEVGYAYIGDGGGCLVRTTGEVEHFIVPQKASETALNLLAASLGPTMAGAPVSGVAARAAGELVMVGTDGVFDRVDETFPREVLQGCLKYNGDLSKTAGLVVEELATFQDEAGYICDDNLTLGILGNGKRPTLAPGFWTNPEGESSTGTAQ